jgi:predicted alpha-1,2-mannosidase
VSRLRRPGTFLACVLLAACGGSGTGGGGATGDSQTRNFTAEVNPFVGTQSGAADFGTGGGAGNTYPGAVLPFGMLQFSPDTSPSLDNFSGGYTYSDTQIEGFSLTHLSGAGCALFQDIPIQPTVAPITASPAPLARHGLNPEFLASFDHAHEAAEPGYYQVRLDPGSEREISVELTATERSGMARFRFPSGAPGSLLINAGGSEMANSEAVVAIDPARREVSGSATSGGFCYQDDKYTVFFVARFDRPFAAWGTWTETQLAPGSTAASDTGVLRTNMEPVPGGPSSLPGNPSGTAKAGAYVSFDTGAGGLVQMRVAISFVSVDNARANLEAENAGRSFEELRAAAREKWNHALGRIEIETADTRLRRMFYTALYHSLLAPSIYSDANGEYRGMDGAVRRADGYTAYGTFSGWDMYRSQLPLLAMLDPARTSDMMQSLVANAAESGALPKWSYANQHTGVMVGDPADLILAGGHAFGARDFDTAAALTAMIRGAAQPAGPERYLGGGNAGYIQRPGLIEYQALGYIPFEENVPTGAAGLVHRGLVWGTSSTTLEYALADFAIDRFAVALGRAAETAALRARSGNWKKLFNPVTGYIEPKLAIGLFLPGSDPASGNGFVEGNSAQYSWFVPQDTAGLVQAMGGREAAAARLDGFFEELNAGPAAAHAFLGNEPSLFTPWLYAYVGQPAKAGPIVHEALTTLYDDAPTGMPGNDDLGAMSAWWVLAALGLNPGIPGTDVLLLSAPLFPSATVHLPGGDLRIRTQGEGPFVQSLNAGGQLLDRAWLRFADVAQGATLAYLLGPAAAAWATLPEREPPSFPAGP